jgi:hypothetical protein
VALPIGGKVLLDTNVLIDYLRAGLHAEWVLGGSGSILRFILPSLSWNYDSAQILLNGKEPWTASSRRFMSDVLSVSGRPS